MTTFLTDNFNDGDYTNNPTWTVRLGTWSAAGFNLKNTTAGQGKISTGMVIDLTAQDVEWNFVVNTDRSGAMFTIIAGTGTNWNLNNDPAYDFVVLADGQPYLAYADGLGSNGAIISGSAGDVAVSTDTTIKITRSSAGSWELFVGGVSKGTTSHTTTTSITSFWTDFRAQNQYLDDIVVQEPITQKSVSDTITLNEDLIKDIKRSFTDTVTLNEDIDFEVKFNLTDTISLTDPAVESSVVGTRFLYQFDLDNPIDSSGTVDWENIDFVQLSFDTPTSGATVVFDYLTASASNFLSLNGIGERFTTKSITTVNY